MQQNQLSLCFFHLPSDTYQWISINCGAESYTLDTKNLINWEPDNEYIQTGMNKNVTQTYINITMQMKNLRYFPQNTSTPNCHSFITDDIGKYIIPASFYYGNYDGLMKPPTFDVSVNGFKWMTVVTSSSQDKPIVIEAIFKLDHD
ncbi:probable leucine-rich repeat receptor-like protein kinase At2g28990 [Dioscorea cayenensis subsp. rotundata]|uniref:Probable leucine-rich repeat receptor-like protein kinase At2g28990 n=1 Tax=Dioscorea cayennensis subsp. rotundata TaxID=55577 RepID=A0AB40BR67_DIOCR|nr:probable leucine-rich repeat receptor-like protein kinase At2g28990 [Dioscorea cayenensis subsp. rotundata]